MESMTSQNTILETTAFRRALIQLSSISRLAAGALFMVVAFSIHIVILLFLLPSRVLRIKATSIFANITGRVFVLISGCPVTVNGNEKLDRHRPAIYVANHTSALDLFVAMWKIPVGTSGVAKKEILYIPFYGQVYLLSGHLIVDRANSEKAVASMKELGELVRKHKLSVFIWPEGTRSRNGKLKPFKKGYLHLAMQTGLPIVPFVISGAQKAWRPNSHILRQVPITVDILNPIDSSLWTAENIDRANEQVRQQFVNILPDDQLETRA